MNVHMMRASRAVIPPAGLAACPAHREAFLKTGGGVAALATAASSVDHHRLPLPPRVADAWRRRCGAAYEESSLLLPAATGLANLTKCGPAAPLALQPICAVGGCCLVSRSFARMLTYVIALSRRRRHRTCVPQLQLGALLLAHRPVHTAAADLAARSANCNASQVSAARMSACSLKRPLGLQPRAGCEL